jgi:DNA-binding response OmpR family regulator
MESDRHRICIAEDDPFIAEQLIEIVRSLDFDYLHVKTLEEQRAAIEEARFCGFIQDIQMPARDGVKAVAASGKTGISYARKRYPERHTDFFHRVWVIVVTSTSKEPDNVMEMSSLGANAFIHKPFGDPEAVAEKIRFVMRSAGAEDHQVCVARACAPADSLVAAGLAHEVPKGPVLSIGGLRVKRTKNVVTLDGKPVELRDQLFEFLVRVVAIHQKTPGAWTARADLRIPNNDEIPSRLQTAFKSVLPEGFVMIQSDGQGKCMLNPHIVLGHIDWKAISMTGNDAVQKIAGERAKARKR